MSPRLPSLLLMAALLAVNTVAVAGTSVVFSKNEISIITDYYQHHRGDADTGKDRKNKSKPLPPGIAKNLTRGKPLPPGIAKQQLPGDLMRQLPPVNPGYERVVVDGRVLLVEVATQVIHDVLMDAIYR
jgi:hypothetical protein